MLFINLFTKDLSIQINPIFKFCVICLQTILLSSSITFLFQKYLEKFYENYLCNFQNF